MTFIAHFAGMGRSSNKYEKIVETMHSWKKDYDTVGHSPSSNNTDIYRYYHRKRRATLDSIFFTIVFRRFKTTRIADLNLLDSCS